MRTCGSWSAYCGGCRCDDCKAASRRYMDGKRKPARASYRKTCRTCGKMWTAWNKRGEFCSKTCWAAEQRRQRLLPVRYSRYRARLAMVAPSPPKPLRRRWYAGLCVECGTSFVHDQPQTRTCSPRCSRRQNRRTSRHKRRAVERLAFIENVVPREIFERDHWRCKLCGKAVARTKTVPHPKAPVLDHIVPLASGGKHERANVQCAHFICNSIKGDRGGGEQLMLIG